MASGKIVGGMYDDRLLTKPVKIAISLMPECSNSKLLCSTKGEEYNICGGENFMETTPNTETLKLLSKLFDVSINTLLGSPRQLICQCCGVPLEDTNISKETDGFFNEEYCKWCYADGEYMYHNIDDLIDVCVNNMANEHFAPEQVRSYMKDMLLKLNYWKQ